MQELECLLMATREKSLESYEKIVYGLFPWTEHRRDAAREVRDLVQRAIEIRDSEVPHKLLIEIYNSGYASGHHDTVEGQYIDILPVDKDSIHSDIVDELIKELT